MAFPFPLGVKVFGLVVDTVRRPVLPLVLFAMGAGASLVLVRLTAVAFLVTVLVLRHLCEFRRRGKGGVSGSRY
jgi:hypothetical protein